MASLSVPAVPTAAWVCQCGRQNMKRAAFCVSCKKQFADENAGASQQRAVSSSRPLLELVDPPSGQSVPAWFQQAVTAANVILQTKEGATLLKDAIERWIPSASRSLDAAEVVRRLFALHAKGALHIQVNYHKDAQQPHTYLSTSRQRLDASGGKPAMFVAQVAMSAEWRTRAAAVAGKSSSEAHLRFGFFVKLMHEVMHCVIMPILRALYFGEEGWNPAAEKLGALPTQQGRLFPPSRLIGVQWLDELGLRIRGESGDQMELALGLPGTLLFHYDDEAKEVRDLHICMRSKISDGHHKEWSWQSFLCTPIVGTPARQHQTSRLFTKFAAFLVEPSLLVQQFLSHPSTQQVAPVLAKLAEVKRLQQPVEEFHWRTFAENMQGESNAEVKEEEAARKQQPLKRPQGGPSAHAAASQQAESSATAAAADSSRPLPAAEIDALIDAVLASEDMHGEEDFGDFDPAAEAAAAARQWHLFGGGDSDDESTDVVTGRT